MVARYLSFQLVWMDLCLGKEVAVSRVPFENRVNRIREEHEKQRNIESPGNQKESPRLLIYSHHFGYHYYVGHALAHFDDRLLLMGLSN